jgi:hypothetical protein
MSTDERIRKRRNFRSPMLILGFTMTLFYFGLGAWLLLDPTFLSGIPTDFRKIFASMVLIYGAYRGWRVYADFF